MAASPQVISTQPEYLNARSGIYTAQDLRKPKDDIIAPGVQDIGSYKVVQRAAGANMSVDVGVTGIFNKAYVRGSTVTDQGLYRVESLGVLNLDIAAAHATNPRIDQIWITVEDQQHAGSNNQATVRVITGTASGGATLDNQAGIGGPPVNMSGFLLADILIPAASVSVVTANIRDRRPVGNVGSVPWLGSTGTQIDAVAFEPAYGQVVNVAIITAGTHDNLQSAAAVWLPRRIVGATRIRWGYLQGATANAGNYALFVADASGRVVAQTAPTAFTGAANVVIHPSVALTQAVTLEAGWYYVGAGYGAMTASSTVYIPGMLMHTTSTVMVTIPYPNIGFRAASGGTTVPVTILAYGDIFTISGAQANPPVPLTELSVG